MYTLIRFLHLLYHIYRIKYYCIIIRSDFPVGYRAVILKLAMARFDQRGAIRLCKT